MQHEQVLPKVIWKARRYLPPTSENALSLCVC